MMRGLDVLSALLAFAAAAPALPVLLPLDEAAAAPAANRLVDGKLEFSRIGYHGAMWFNRDGTYVIVQIDPKSNAAVFSGSWTAKGSTGFCMIPATSASPSKCFETTPSKANSSVTITSSLGEVYRVVLRTAR